MSDTKQLFQNAKILPYALFFLSVRRRSGGCIIEWLKRVNFWSGQGYLSRNVINSARLECRDIQDVIQMCFGRCVAMGTCEFFWGVSKRNYCINFDPLKTWFVKKCDSSWQFFETFWDVSELVFMFTSGALKSIMKFYLQSFIDFLRIYMFTTAIWVLPADWSFPLGKVE